MKTHHVEWYESEDGKMFADEMECIAHEVNYLYHQSGVRFYIGDELIENLEIENDLSYNQMTDIYIDRTKKNENEKFSDSVEVNLGWDYIVDAVKGLGKHYQFAEAMSNIMTKIE